jgi:hypothetical protein
MPFELEIIGIKYYHVVISGLYKIDSVENSMQNFSKQGKEALFFFSFWMFSFGHDIIDTSTKYIAWEVGIIY